jgi:Mg2+ and Co2+ transporter CorA
MSIDALLSRGDGTDELVDLARWNGRKIGKDELLWIDLVDGTSDEAELTRSALGIGDETWEALRSPAPTPSATVRGDAVEVVVLAPGREAEDRPTVLQILTGEGWVVTNHERPIPFLEEHRERIQDQREVGLLSAVEFLAVVLSWHVDAFVQAAVQLEHDVDELDDAALRTDRDLLRRLVSMRRRISRLRRMLIAHRGLYSDLGRPDFLNHMDEREMEAMSTVVQRLERALDGIGNAREMLIGTFDIHMTRTAQRTNDVMRVLTLASVILLPSVVLAGVMGMNFKVPLFDNPNMFWVVIGLMVTLAVGTVVAAKWLKWL